MANSTDGVEEVGNTKCLLLTKVPLEIRRSIYCYVFSGSKLTFSLRTLPYMKPLPIRKGQSAGVISTDHWKFLLMCPQTYDEARAVFCEGTIVSQDPQYLQAVRASLLTKRISDFTMAHVRHLRNIQLETSLLRPNDISDILSQFPKLTTCQLLLPFKKLVAPWKFALLDTQTLLDQVLGVDITSMFMVHGLLEMATRVTFLA